MWFVYVLAGVVVLVLDGILANNASDIAVDKGYSGRKWFHMCFWLGPIAYIIVAAMPDRKLQTLSDDVKEMVRLQQKLLEKLDAMAQVIPADGSRQSADRNEPAAEPQVQDDGEVGTASLIPDGSNGFYKMYKCSECGAQQSGSNSICWNCKSRFKK